MWGSKTMDKSVEDKRGAIIEAAYQVFSARGFAHSQVVTIAELSHISTATIYKLFDSKEKLFLAAYDHGLDILESHVCAGSVCAGPLRRHSIRADGERIFWP